MAGLREMAVQKKHRARLREFLEERFFLRFHMFLILAGTFLAGLITTKILFELDIGSMLIRYPVAVVSAYLAFP